MTHTIKKYLTLIWKRTGRNYIYVMWSWRLFWCVKIGVSDTPGRRRGEINKSVSDKMGYNVGLLYLAIPILLGAYKSEKVLHRYPLSIRFRWLEDTDGKNEWFFCINWWFTFFFLIGCTYYDVGMYQWSVVFLLPCLPLDAILITTLFVLLQWALILGAVWLGWMGLNIIF